MEGETQPPQLSVRLGHPTWVQQAFWHLRSPLSREGSFAENLNCLRLSFLFQLGRLQASATLPCGSWLGESPREPRVQRGCTAARCWVGTRGSQPPAHAAF